MENQVMKSLVLIWTLVELIPGSMSSYQADLNGIWGKIRQHDEALDALDFEVSQIKQSCDVELDYRKEGKIDFFLMGIWRAGENQESSLIELLPEPKTVLILGPNDYNGPNVELLRINPRNVKKHVYCKGVKKLKDIHGQLYGAYINETNSVIICEGRFCLERDFRVDEEIRRFDIDDYREYSSSVMIDPSTWWVTGGTYDLSMVLNSTKIFKNGKFLPGTDLPQERTGHCLIKVNDTSYFMMGTANYYEHEVTKLWIFDSEESKWSSLPNLDSVRREPPMCGMITHRNEEGKAVHEIVIVDGKYPTEILNLNTLEWRRGPPLPVEFRFGTTLQYGDSFLILGGLVNERASFRGLQKGEMELKSILEYDVDTEKWNIRDDVMNRRRSKKSGWFTAFYVPNDWC